MCKVVHIKEKYDVYIGRGKCPQSGELSKWGNPFTTKLCSIAEFKVDTREEAIQYYEKYLLSSPDLLKSLHELKYKTIGCWCKPNKSCHGDIIKKYVDRLERDDQRKKLLDW